MRLLTVECRSVLSTRFLALNPHGCVDFIYDSGGFNQYLDMLSAHISYWQSPSFATFVLLQLFSDFQKQAPTVVPTLASGEEGQTKAQQDVEGDGEDEKEDNDDSSSNDDSSNEEDARNKGFLAALLSSGIM
jgi:hypothetical protein